MPLNPLRNGWFFPVHETPIRATVTRNGTTMDVIVPHKKALVAADSGEIVGVVGDGYKVFTNEEAVHLCQKFCLDAFPDTKAAEWMFVDGHGPGTRSWAALDIHHQSHTMNLMDIPGGPSEVFTPYVRITNSYNGTRALRVDVGFLRTHCGNGVIFEQQAATLSVPHTRQGIRTLKVVRPFTGMAALREKFANALAGVRAVAVTQEQALQLVRLVIGWPKLPEDPKAWELTDQTRLDADLEARLGGYFRDLNANAYAAFNTMTDIASHPPQSPRFRRDRPSLERRAGAWLRDFTFAAAEPGFTIPAHLEKLAKPAQTPQEN